MVFLQKLLIIVRYITNYTVFVFILSYTPGYLLSLLFNYNLLYCYYIIFYELIHLMRWLTCIFFLMDGMILTVIC